MKIVLVDNFEYIKTMHQYPTAPAGLLTLATIMTRHGYEVEIINFNYLFMNRLLPYHDDPAQKFMMMAQYILARQPDVVGFTSVCSLFHNALLLSRVLKSLQETGKIIFGGPHVSSFPAKILARYPWIDAVCIGEAEGTIIPIMEGLVQDRLDGVLGVAYRRGKEIIQNEPAELIAELDTLPLVDYSLIPAFRDIREIPLETGRGCPYRCIYCSTAGFWQRKFRVKSIARICREIVSTQQALQGKPVFYNFVHDNFTTNYEFTTKLCRELQKLHISWGCGARVDTLDEPLISLMAEAGCQSMLIGLETASPAMQRYIKKELDIDRFLCLVDVIAQHHITLIVSFIYGFPPETRDDLRATLAMMVRLMQKGVYSHLHSLGVLYGTPLYDLHQHQLVLKDYYSDLGDPSNLELCLSYVREDKDIFSQFYALPGTLAEPYCFLDKFVNLIYVKLYYLFPETFQAILRVFQEELLDFYDDFLLVVPGFGDFIQNGQYNAVATRDGYVTEKSPLSRQLIAFLTDYLNRKAWSDFQFKIILQQFCGEKVLAGSRLAPSGEGER